MAIVRNIQNDDLYLYLGNDEYENLRTKTRGKIAPELAQKTLKINVEATYLYHNYPNFVELISKLNLKVDKQ